MAKEASPTELAAAQREDVGPVRSDPASQTYGDPVADLYFSQQADPELFPRERPFESVNVVDLKINEKFVFLSKPGLRGINLNIDVPEFTDDDDRAAMIAKSFERRYRGKEEQFAFQQKVADQDELNGVPIIAFKPLAGKFQCMYETSNPVIADYIRKTAEFADGRILEQSAPMTVTVNGKTIRVVAADQESRLALSQAQAQG